MTRTMPPRVCRSRTTKTLCKLLLAGTFCSLLSCSSPSNNASSSPPVQPLPAQKEFTSRDLKTLERQIHDRINKERVRQGLPTMRWDDALGRIAIKHSRDMARNGYFSHRSPQGKDVASRYMQSGYACGVTVNGVLRHGAENIFRLFPTEGEDPAGATLQGWLEKNDDRKNILSPHWGRQGIGVSTGPDGALYITLNLC